MATITTSPSLLVTRVNSRVVFQPTTGNFLRAWIYDAPLGSQWRARLDATGSPDDLTTPTPSSPPQKRIRLDLREVPRGFEWSFSADRGGKYLLAVQEYVRGTNFGGSYADDPDAQRKENAVGALQLASVDVAQFLEVTLGAPPDLATLRIAVRGNEIVGTNIETNRLKTPTVLDPHSSRAAAALVHPDVLSALDALVGLTASEALGDPSALVTQLINRWNGHLVESGVHAVDDTVHSVSTSFRSPESPQGIEQAITELRRQMSGHFSNSDVSGVAEEGFHTEQGDGLPPVYGTLSSLASLWLAYEQHRVSEDMHETADNTNALGSLPPLYELVRVFISVASLEPVTTPPVVNSAATTLIHGAGFEEKERF